MDYEITEDNMDRLKVLLCHLEELAGSTPDIESIEIHVVFDGQKYVIGYGEAGEPAVLIPAGPDPCTGN